MQRMKPPTHKLTSYRVSAAARISRLYEQGAAMSRIRECERRWDNQRLASLLALVEWLCKARWVSAGLDGEASAGVSERLMWCG